MVACPATRKAAVIDPAPESSDRILSFLESHHLQCIAILLTHSHWDHIADVSAIKEACNVPVYIHSLDVPNLERPGADGLPCWLPLEGIKPDVLLKEGDRIDIGEHSFSVIHTPGHSPGGICLYSALDHILFSGDTLFKGTIGNLSFPTCQPDKMWPSLEKLSKLPPETKVYPGHGNTTTIGRESWLSHAKEKFG